MPNRRLSNVLGQIRKLGAAVCAADATDAELLLRFAEGRDEIAFGTLVKRHHSMVLAVCLRVLSHTQDAEDACQATFLVLAQKAASIRKVTSLSSWLHGVAFRTASNLRVERSRRRTREAAAQAAPKTENAGLSWQEVQAILDEELLQLPESLRAPLLLCLLEGKTRDEAAQELGWTVSTLRGRLERGRKRLQARLVQRGLTLSVALLGVFVFDKAAAAALPPVLLNATVQAALLVAAGQPTTGVVSSHVAVLMKGALQSMLVTKMKIAGLFMLAVSILGIGAGLFMHRAMANDQPEPPAALFANLDGPTIVVLDQPDDKKPEKGKDAKPAGDAKTPRFQMEGVLEEIDAKENYVTLRDMIRFGTMEMAKIKGKDGFSATLKLTKPTILKNLRVLADAKISDDGKEKKLSELKAGTTVRVDLEYRRDGLVVVAMQKTKGGGNNLRIIGGKDGAGIIIEGFQIQIDGGKKKDEKKP